MANAQQAFARPKGRAKKRSSSTTSVSSAKNKSLAAKHRPPLPADPSTTQREMARIVVRIKKVESLLQQLIRGGFNVAQRAQRKPLPEYAKVVAVGSSPDVGKAIGLTGLVLDAAENEAGWSYTVYFPSLQEAIVLQEASLWDSGETIPEDVIYGNGATRRVRVDSNNEGTLVA